MTLAMQVGASRVGGFVFGTQAEIPLHQNRRLRFPATLFYSRHASHKPMPNQPQPEPRDLFRGALEIMVLRTLRREPMHGYALVQHIQNRSEYLLQVEEGSLYPALQRLLKDGLVKAQWQTSGTGRRVRVYTLTRAGAKRLDSELSSFERMMKGISLVLYPAEP